jgi:hypothetical protein
MRLARAAVAFTLCITAGLHAQARNLLPPPTGPAAIGRVTYHWIDSSRLDPLVTRGSALREVMVDVWYPAARSARPPASYLPHTVLLQQALPDSVLRRRYAPMYEAVMAGSVVPHAVDGAAAMCPASGCPLLVFSHGGGVDRSSYTAQYEDLASHGYIVAAVAHPYLTHTLVFPDGRVARLAARPRELMSGDSTIALWRRQIAASAAWGMIRYRIAAADVRFVIDRMTHLSRDRSLGAPFHGKIDLQRVGALGHSMGGLATSLACATDARIKACMNQDGTTAALTVVRDSSGRTLSQPFLYFGRVEPPPPPSADSVLARIQMTRAEEDSLAVLRPRQHDSVFTALPGGAWRLRLRTPGAKHMSFSDEPLVETAGDSTSRAATLLTVDVIRRYTRAFFDKTLRGRRDTLFDRPEPSDSAYLSIERFPQRER